MSNQSKATIFTSKKQFNQISQLISNTFDIKENRVEHKLSQACQFSNSNAMKAFLSKNKEKPAVELKPQLIDDINFKLLFSDHKTTLLLKNDSHITQVNFNGCLIFQLFSQGFITHNAEILSTPFFIDDFEIENKMDNLDVADLSLSQKPCFQYNDSLFTSTLMHLLGKHIFSTQELSMMTTDQLIELVQCCSIPQYNLIAELSKNNNNNHNIGESVNIRYIKELSMLCDDLDFEYDEEECQPNIKLSILLQIRNSLDPEHVVSIIETPPIGYLHKESIKNLSYESCPVESLNEHVFNTNSTPIGLRVSDIVNDNKKQKDFDDVDCGIIRQMVFTFEAGYQAYKVDGKYDFQINDLLYVAEKFALYLPETLLLELLNEKIENNLQYNRYSFLDDSKNWYGLSIGEFLAPSLIDSFLFDCMRKDFTLFTKMGATQQLNYEHENLVKFLFSQKSITDKPFDHELLKREKEVEIDRVQDSNTQKEMRLLIEELEHPQTIKSALSKLAKFKQKIENN